MKRKYKGLREASRDTKKYATTSATSVAVLLHGDTVTTRVLAGTNSELWGAEADRIIYANAPMTMAQIEAALNGRPLESPQTRYDRDNTVMLSVKLNRKSDRDLLDWLSAQPNKQGAVKAALRAQMSAACGGG